MLRTHEAALYAIGGTAIGDLCEAICLDAVEVVQASRVSVWFFVPDGSLVCQRMVDAADGRIQQGAVIPAEATRAYLDAASRGLKASVTEDAPPLHGSNAPEINRLDLLLVDGVNAPAAVFRCERDAGAADWSERDLYILRSMAQVLAATIRREARVPKTMYSSDRAAARRRLPQPPIGMMPQNLDRLGLDRGPTSACPTWCSRHCPRARSPRPSRCHPTGAKTANAELTRDYGSAAGAMPCAAAAARTDFCSFSNARTSIWRTRSRLMP